MPADTDGPVGDGLRSWDVPMTEAVLEWGDVYELPVCDSRVTRCPAGISRPSGPDTCQQTLT